jgi:hypothetical protein
LKYAFYKNALSIGFVTSPLISDFYMSKFDKAIEDFISKNPKLHYSRYSDDMLLSSEEDDNLSELYGGITEEMPVFMFSVSIPYYIPENDDTSSSSTYSLRKTNLFDNLREKFEEMRQRSLDKNAE